LLITDVQEGEAFSVPYLIQRMAESTVKIGQLRTKGICYQMLLQQSNKIPNWWKKKFNSLSLAPSSKKLQIWQDLPLF
jgi:hypothetical protein